MSPLPSHLSVGSGALVDVLRWAAPVVPVGAVLYAALTICFALLVIGEGAPARGALWTGATITNRMLRGIGSMFYPPAKPSRAERIERLERELELEREDR